MCVYVYIYIYTYILVVVFEVYRYYLYFIVFVLLVVVAVLRCGIAHLGGDQRHFRQRDCAENRGAIRFTTFQKVGVRTALCQTAFWSPLKGVEQHAWGPHEAPPTPRSQILMNVSNLDCSEQAQLCVYLVRFYI